MDAHRAGPGNLCPRQDGMGVAAPAQSLPRPIPRLTFRLACTTPSPERRLGRLPLDLGRGFLGAFIVGSRQTHNGAAHNAIENRVPSLLGCCGGGENTGVNLQKHEITQLCPEQGDSFLRVIQTNPSMEIWRERTGSSSKRVKRSCNHNRSATD